MESLTGMSKQKTELEDRWVSSLDTRLPRAPLIAGMWLGREEAWV